MILGGLPRQSDFRDFNLGAVQAPQPYPETYLTDLSIYTKYYQNGLGICGAEAGTGIKIVQETKELNSKQDFSRRYLWNVIKRLINDGKGDGYPLDVGTDMRSIFKALSGWGVCDSSLVNDDVKMSIEEYTKLQITGEMNDNAQPRIIKSYAFLPNGFDAEDIKQAIYQNSCVLLLLWVDNGWFGTDVPTFTEHKYGHFVVGVGYDKDYLYVIDSTEYGLERSVKKISWEYISFIREVGTSVDLPDEEVKKLMEQRKNLLIKLLSLLQQKFNLLKRSLNY